MRRLAGHDLLGAALGGRFVRCGMVHRRDRATPPLLNHMRKLMGDEPITGGGAWSIPTRAEAHMLTDGEGCRAKRLRHPRGRLVSVNADAAEVGAKASLHRPAGALLQRPPDRA